MNDKPKHSARLKAASLIATASTAAGTAAITCPTASAVTWTPGPAEYIGTYSTPSTAVAGDHVIDSSPDFIKIDIDQDGQSDFQLGYYGSFFFEDGFGFFSRNNWKTYNETSRFLGTYQISSSNSDINIYSLRADVFADTQSVYNQAINTTDLPELSGSYLSRDLLSETPVFVGGIFEGNNQQYAVYFELEIEDSKRLTIYDIGYTAIPEPAAACAALLILPALRRRRSEVK